MWMSFALGVCAGAVLLYIPGYLFWKALGFDNVVAFVVAPVATMSAIGVFGILFFRLNISCTWWNTCGLLACIGAAIWAIRSLLLKQGKQTILSLNPLHITLRNKRFGIDQLGIPLCILIAALTTGVVFVTCLGSADAFINRYDNAAHINLVRAFADSGAWSSLYPDRYAASPSNPDMSVGFYPSAWHGYAAAICNLTNIEPTVAVNASMTAILVLTTPTCMYLLCRVLVPESRTVPLIAVFMMSLLPTYPYVLLWKGPLYPQLTAFILLLPILAAAIQYTKAYLPKRWPSFIIFGLVSLIALALSQPSSLFAGCIFYAAFIGHVIFKKVQACEKIVPHRRTPCAIIATSAFAVAFALFWYACFKLPFLQSVVTYRWASRIDLLELWQYAIQLIATRPVILLVGFAACAICVLFIWIIAKKNAWWVLLIPACCAALIRGEILFVAAGLAGCFECFRRKQLWLIVPSLYLGFAFFLSFATEGFLKQFLSGFWYTDQPRIICCMCLFAIPITGLGIYSIAQHIWNKFTPLSKKTRTITLTATLCACLLLSIFPTIPIPATNVSLTSDLTRVHNRLYNRYHSEAEAVLNQQEKDFIHKAMQYIPEGEMVINQPHDGSVFAYGVTGLETYYRLLSTGSLSPEATIIRESLSQVAANPEVKQALRSVPAEYLLVLDHNVPFEEGVWLSQYSNPDVWRGIDSIQDDTPGFTVVLAEDDMRLYKIEGVF